MIKVTFKDGTSKSFIKVNGYDIEADHYVMKWRGGRITIPVSEVRMIEIERPLCLHPAEWMDGDLYVCRHHVNVLSCAEKYEGEKSCMCYA